MKNKSAVSTWIISRMVAAAAVVAVAACAGTNDENSYAPVATPTVDYVESLDVYSAPHQDSFLNQLAMNYRSYAIYNARTSGYPDMGELFAQKAVAAFSGELPFPEVPDNWPTGNEQDDFELYTAYNELLDQLTNDASMTNPKLAAEAQAKYDCWVSAAASGQMGTAEECRDRFQKTMTALRDCNGGRVIEKNNTNTTTTQTTETVKTTITSTGEPVVAVERDDVPTYYPDTRNMAAMNGAARAREGVIIVNNVNVPEHLINPVPVQPMVFNQNIYGGDKTKNVSNSNNDSSVRCLREGDVNCVQNPTPVVVQTESTETTVSGPVDVAETTGTETVTEPVVASESVAVAQPEPIPMISDELVTREEFINMMMAMRAELAAINARLDQIQANQNVKDDEKTIIKVQQIPLEPKQHVMEEILEIRFDFDKATVKPEYEDLIRQLATATQENKNIKVSVVGHTDTMGTKDYNYALGGRRAEAVQKMLVKYGIPASQIVVVSAGEEDLAVQTGDQVPNAENRRVRVVKEVHYTEPGRQVPVAVVEEYTVPSGSGVCGMYGCSE